MVKPIPQLSSPYICKEGVNASCRSLVNMQHSGYSLTAGGEDDSLAMCNFEKVLRAGRWKIEEEMNVFLSMRVGETLRCSD